MSQLKPEKPFVPAPETERQIREVCKEIEEMLISKNRSYGDSALNPLRIFSKADALTGLQVRMDDKLSRMMQGKTDFDHEDTEWDLLGYLILIRVARKRLNGAKRDEGPYFQTRGT